MTVLGVALLALCTLVGVFLGDLLGILLGVKANVGGVGIAMMLLIAARIWLMRHDRLGHATKLGVEFWASMYIPIVVAMAAQQNVVAAVSGGPIVIIAAVGSVLLCFAATALLGRIGGRPARDSAEAEPAAAVIAGDVEAPSPVRPTTASGR
ncbi:malonate transporter, MadL subunit [Methylorubrum populi BJ001]|jgi:malonate transporter MadL subunit|uniref:Malonate transporter, MadL subunit n=1 Tax=Methylorubrum populi (strain ATCC BAA-705 / NCIMB 13946 / BJ001) TaxID=441620 RepID=B1ZEZ4_METPB|nr:malonate transporter subunit MadL [Methylorubrum populi]ACB78241.1 malonate transporter, MadL subunit [Methylorubrum populi BJ001]OAH39383.1 malonate transporter subunit MadL [Methylorubrum populi]PZP71849.1 MAG: malonate transporter subunit MadL [Methylorubrum populi]QDI78983.1 malonate transporter subunit MadL [Methylorubrum populi]